MLQETKQLCDLYGIKPARSKGQNFLITNSIYDKVVAAANLHKDDIVLEVGPGLGFLTKKLAKYVKQVLAVELDFKLAEALQARLDLDNIKNVEVINQDILQYQVNNQIKKYKIVANLPYNITSFFLRTFLEADNKPELMVLLLQKEVVKRILAKPGDMSLLALSVQFYSNPQLIDYVAASNFWPKPEIDSAIIKIDLLKSNRGLTQAQLKKFWQIARIGFSSKRKMLKNNLAGGFKIEPNLIENKLIKINLNPKVRAEDLAVEDWLKLFAELAGDVV